MKPNEQIAREATDKIVGIGWLAPNKNFNNQDDKILLIILAAIMEATEKKQKELDELLQSILDLSHPNMKMLLQAQSEDTKRLDWLSSRAGTTDVYGNLEVEIHHHPDEDVNTIGKTLREAIDAAVKGG